METWEIDNVNSQADLKQKITDRLDAQLDQYHETTVTALELGLLDDQLELIELGNRYVLNTDGRLLANNGQRVVRQELNLLEPQKSSLTFGIKYQTLVDILSERS